jgi:hypothetical protein
VCVCVCVSLSHSEHAEYVRGVPSAVTAAISTTRLAALSNELKSCIGTMASLRATLDGEYDLILTAVADWYGCLCGTRT